MKFDDDFAKDERTFRFMFKAFWWFFGVVTLCIVAAIIMVCVTVVNVSANVEKDGLRAVIERVWCGSGVSCLTK